MGCSIRGRTRGPSGTPSFDHRESFAAVNIESDDEETIRYLAYLAVETGSFNNEIVCSRSKPDGKPCKFLEV